MVHLEADEQNNHLTGKIPASIGNLVNLTNLNVGGNNLTGTIPSSIGNLVNLQALYLWINRFTGSINWQNQYQVIPAFGKVSCEA